MTLIAMARSALLGVTLSGAVALGQPVAQAPLSESKKISVEYRGTLKDALREIASKGGINLVVTGDLDQSSEVYLKDVTAEEALATVAAAYHLKVTQHGTIWTLRPMNEDELESAIEKAEDEAEAEAAAPQPSKQPLLPAAPPPVPRASKKGRSSNDRVGTGPVVVEAGKVVDSAVSYGGSVTLQPGAVVEDDVVAFGGDVILESGAIIEGDAVSFGGQIKKGPGSEVHGEEVSMGGSLGSKVGAGLASTIRAQEDGRGDEKASENRDDRLGKFLLKFALLFGLGFLFMMFAPARMKQLESELRSDPVKCGLTGLIGAAALFPLSVLLVVTVIGILPMIALWVMVMLGVAMGIAAIAAQVGSRLPVPGAKKTQAVVLALGLLALLLAAQVPVLGPIAIWVLCLISLGAIIRTRFGQRPRGFPEADPIADATVVG